MARKATRKERSAINKAAWAEERKRVPLSGPLFEVELPAIEWKPGDGPTEEVVAAVLEVVEQGPSLRWIHREAAKAGIAYPNPSTWNMWVAQDSELSGRYARARETRADTLVEMSMEVSAGSGRSDSTRDRMGPIQRDKLYSDTIRWFAGKLSPQYNDKIQIEADVKVPGVLVVPAAAGTVAEWEAKHGSGKGGS